MSSSKEESSDNDDGFNEDMEALRRACRLIGITPDAGGITSDGASSDAESDSDGNDDLQLVQSVQKRFAFPMDNEEEPLIMKPLCTLMPDWSDSDDIDDDYATLQAIQRRFAAYNNGSFTDSFEDILHRPEQVGATIIDSEKGTSNSFVERTNAQEGFLNCVDTSKPSEKLDECGHASGGSDVIECYGRGADDVVGLPLKNLHFPNSALSFVDAIKKNRSCQKLLWDKMTQMKARKEELGKLIECVRILKDFQVACKKRTGRALSQKKDPRVQLISVRKLKGKMKLNKKNIPASYKGPPENVHVSKYKEALAAFAIPVKKEQWSKEERKNLVEGVKQQFQDMLLQRSFDILSEEDRSYDSSNVDCITESIKDIDITPEIMRSFLPKVNWEQLAAMYVSGRCGAECQAMFLNSEDPLINHGPWTAMEDKNILHIIQEKGLSNWIDIAASLGTNRTPFQCLARYQRSLNASILKREWTSEEDNQLRAAVETYGESNWQVVASAVEGRTGTQCSNRWLKTLHPTRVRSGKWTSEEDKRLKVAATLFGPKSWKKVARCVPGRTHVQCRERWVNCLDPSINKAEWTEEEDLKLEEAIAKHGYCWSKVAACIPHRTDNQCWRRWKVLFPTEVQLLQTARKIQKTALISNFVDRESERPALGPNDFQLPAACITGSENVDPSNRKKKRPKRREANQPNEKDAFLGEVHSEELLRLTDGSKLEIQRSVHWEGRCKSSHSTKYNAGPSSDALYMSNGEEITESYANDGNNKRKPRLRKKRPGMSVAATSFAVIGDESCSKMCEPFDPIEEQTPANPNLHDKPLDAELGGDNAIQMAKASKLQPRRRNSRKLKEVQETQSKVSRQAVAESKVNNDKKLKTNHQSSFSDTMCLIDVMRATEAGFRTESKKRKNSERNLSVKHSGSEVDPKQYVICNTDGSVPVNLDQPGINMQCEENDLSLLLETEDRSTPATVQQSGSDTTHPPSLLVYLRRKRKRISQVNIGSINATDGSRNEDKACRDQASEVEAEDDCTLAHFFSKLKKRRTQEPKV